MSKFYLNCGVRSAVLVVKCNCGGQALLLLCSNYSQFGGVHEVVHSRLVYLFQDELLEFRAGLVLLILSLFTSASVLAQELLRHDFGDCPGRAGSCGCWHDCAGRARCYGRQVLRQVRLQGYFELKGLPIGSYNLTIEHRDFAGCSSAA